MKTALWIGSRPQVVCSAHKQDLALQPWQSAMRIAFRFEIVWCVVDQEQALALTTGELLPITLVYTNDGKTLIGRDDAYQTGLDYNDDARTFRSALDERAQDAAKLNQA